MYPTYAEFKYQSSMHMRVSPRLKCYDDKLYRLVVLKRNIDYTVRSYTEKGKGENLTKLDHNLIRAKNTVLELALCNDWDWFVTLTLDSKKYDRHDLRKYIKDLGQFVRDYRKRKGGDVKYLFVPEQHEDGAWHIHGLLSGINADDIKKFEYADGVPKKLVDGDYYNWLSYAKKFGFVSLGKIKDNIKVAFYIKKYITKAMAENNMSLNAKTYYCSQKLKRAQSLDLDLRSLYDTDVWRLGYISDFCDTYILERSEGEQLLKNYTVMGDESILFGGSENG